LRIYGQRIGTYRLGPSRVLTPSIVHEDSADYQGNGEKRGRAFICTAYGYVYHPT